MTSEFESRKWMEISLIICDDQPVICDAFALLLNMENDLNVLGIAHNGAEAVELCQRHHVDVALLDIQMPVMNGIEATEKIKQLAKETKVVVLTTFADENYILQALLKGASAYVLKDQNTEMIIQTIRQVMNGQLVLPDLIASRLYDHTKRLQEQQTSILSDEVSMLLSEREREIAQLLAQGMTNTVIASTLFLSLGTVRNYVSTIYRKLNVTSRPEAMKLLRAQAPLA